MISNYEIFKTKDLAVLNIFKSLIQKSIKKIENLMEIYQSFINLLKKILIK